MKDKIDRFIISPILLIFGGLFILPVALVLILIEDATRTLSDYFKGNKSK